jgi:hypothetical protein
MSRDLADQKQSFELYRQGLREVVTISFDELELKIRRMIELLES